MKRFLLAALLLFVPMLPLLHAQSPRWTPMPAFPAGTLYTLIVDSLDRIYATGYEGRFRSTDDGISWTKVEGWLLGVDPAGHLFSATTSSVDRSDDGGITWTTGGPYDSLAPLVGIRALGVAPDGILFVGDFDRGLYRSQDQGRSWTKLSGIPTGVHTIGFGPGGRVFASLDSGFYFSDDHGDSWQAGIAEHSPQVLLTTRSGTVIGGTPGHGILRSTDRGEHLSAVVPAGPQATYSVAGLSEGPAGDLYAATYEAGVLRSTDDGVTWTLANNGIGRTRDFMAVACTRAGTLLAGGITDTIFRASASSGITPGTGAVDPFGAYARREADGIVIGWRSPRPGAVTIEIVDAAGRLVTGRTEPGEAGDHRLLLPPGSIGTGAYFCRVSSPDGVGVAGFVVTR